MTTVERAEQTLLEHSADDDGWCRFHLYWFSLHIEAGKCSSYLLAAGFVRGRRSEQARRRPVSPEFRHT
jgi:hypothetical protein